MRLLDVHAMKLRTFYGDSIPPYAILSHTWLRDDEEVTFTQIQNPQECRQILGFRKIEYLCQQAIKDGCKWAWMDTCCIDKTNSSELSEAINSMFSWYQESTVCYAYLVDVDTTFGYDILSSRWWSRAWTLQELLAPSKVIFYDNSWTQIGTKEALAYVISKKTSVDHEVLCEPKKMYLRSVAQRMAWAADREATRIEDVAYSLLGIFGINMSMKYGEGQLAFLRLQKKILKHSNDQSLFAWSFSPHTLHTLDIMRATIKTSDTSNSSGIFSDAPRKFVGCNDLVFHNRYVLDDHVGEFNGALRIMMPLANATLVAKPPVLGGASYYVGILPCGCTKQPYFMVGLLLREWTDGRFERVALADGHFTFLIECHSIGEVTTKAIWVDHSLWIERHNHPPAGANSIHKNVHIRFRLPAEEYSFEVLSPHPWTFDQETQTINCHDDTNILPNHLSIGLRQYKYERNFIITVGLESEPDKRTSYSSIGTISINRVAKIDHETRKREIQQFRRYKHQRLEDNVNGIYVSLRIQKVLNHILSTVTVSSGAFSK